MEPNIIFAVIAGALAVFGLVKHFRASSAGNYGLDWSKDQQSRDSSDFNATYILIALVAVGGIFWLISGGFNKPIGAPPALQTSTTGVNSYHSNSRGHGLLSGMLRRGDPLKMITPSR
jgi:hypothetical protein